MTDQDTDANTPTAADPFWRKPLEALSPTEWESLCDGCGRCCLVKLEDEDTRDTYYTDVACKLLDAGTCRCSDYIHRQTQVPDCIRLTPEAVRAINWLPPTCAYRLVREGRDLPWWHPLVSGRPETVVEAGVSVRGKIAAHETEVPPENLQGYIVTWPNRVPKKARGPKRKA
ncbi:YcgN family cysteine cluster protein [Lichenifustis flavocetrariae]|uniref:UPF0260 protein M8523_05670 n=1 Tax=Lichenifustis flavocetrariae TaxID=2949735 RepID=A0AA41YUW9_9HYPH|nr:YcgN family cysteine cluster protein [Lichenifustis flavocetrariae]MCW6507507.1 YcgN family cysteine cluster protein [Lichenifustis flavocetrariae]